MTSTPCTVSAARLVTPASDNHICSALLHWFAENARDLPWRHARTPYSTWVSEIMLQQTRSEVVVPYFARFMEHFPSLDALASARLEQVLKTWEGLGYYGRARRLHAAAQQVRDEHGGVFPDTYEALLELPGVGPYTAGAIASISFNRPVVAVDGNVRRVVSRLLALEGTPGERAFEAAVRETAMSLLPSSRPGSLNEALMELGATVCLPRAPHCVACPVRSMCRARATDAVNQYPTRSDRRPIPHRTMTAGVVVRSDGRILITRRRPSRLLGGMWRFPGGEHLDTADNLAEGLARALSDLQSICVEVGDKILEMNHAYTHFRITLHAYLCRPIAEEPDCAGDEPHRWIIPEELSAFPMAVTDRRIAETVGLLLAGRTLPPSESQRPRNDTS